ncbi:MAG: right-handed parallel beta-helix repeat-containing protein [Gemmatimonadales bacterium]|nr:right-handed parallel beta-helix repeat-containing protein [Gemmatimonadales bacterium]
MPITPYPIRIHLTRIMLQYCALTAGVWACSPTSPIPDDITLPPLSPACASATRRIGVGNLAQLTAALAAVRPGDCIRVAAGSYAFGASRWTRSGTEAERILLEGAGPSTVFTLGGSGGIYLQASYWTIRRLRLTDGFFGLQTEGAAYVELDSLEIDHLNQTAVNLFYGTNHTTVRRSKIHHTGQGTARYGEGVYIGGNAALGSSAADDAADDNSVLDNQFGPSITAEAIDISRGADRVTAAGNTMDGTGTVSESGFTNSLVGVRGVDHQITDNVLIKGAPNGIDVYEGSATFRRNQVSLESEGVGIRVAEGAITVYCDNVVTNISSGGAAYNVPCTP